MGKAGYEIKERLFGMLLVLGNRLQTVGNNFYEEITSKQWFVMASITLFAEEPPTMNEIADAIGSSHQNIKQIVMKLEKADFVKMYTDETDRRKTRVKLTDKYIVLEQKYNKKEGELLSAIYDGIDPAALKLTAETLAKLEQNIIHLRG